MAETTKIYTRQMPHPVTLISVSDGKEENIATMSWCSPVSFEPPLVMVAIRPNRFTHDILLRSGEFGLMVLSEMQKEMATLAGTLTGSKAQKWELETFRRFRKEPRTIRAALLRECRAVYECKLTNHMTAGDHTIFVGEIIHGEIDPDQKPLILFDRKYFGLGDFIARYP